MSSPCISLEELRARSCLSRAELAQMAQLSPATVWRIERRKHLPVPATRRRLAAALSADPLQIAWPAQRAVQSSVPLHERDSQNRDSTNPGGRLSAS
jgi:transcriptional regulator with XRE-family HTH domain